MTVWGRAGRGAVFAAALAAVTLGAAALFPAKAAAADALGAPSPLPETLAEFPGGRVTAEEFRAALRAQALRLPGEAGAAWLRQAAAMAAREGKQGDAGPVADVFYGWDAEIVMSVGERDFTWREAIDFCVAGWMRAAAAEGARGGRALLPLRTLLKELARERVLRNEAAAMGCDCAVAEAAEDCLRRALAPLFTPVALQEYYQRNQADFMVIKARATRPGAAGGAAPATATVYVAGGAGAWRVPITAYGVDYLRVGGQERTPLIDLPVAAVAALRRGEAATVDGVVYEAREKLLPRQPEKALDAVARCRLEREVARLLDAVLGKARLFDFVPDKERQP